MKCERSKDQKLNFAENWILLAELSIVVLIRPKVDEVSVVVGIP